MISRFGALGVVLAVIATLFFFSSLGGDPEAGPSLVSLGAWTTSESIEIELDVALGVPYADGTWAAGDSGILEFDVAPNSTTLRVDVRTEPVNATSAGSGFVTFLVGPKGDEQRPAHDDAEVAGYAFDVSPRNATRASVDAPQPTTWRIWIWPKGAVVRQVVEVRVELEGIGTRDVPLDLRKGHPVESGERAGVGRPWASHLHGNAFGI